MSTENRNNDLMKQVGLYMVFGTAALGFLRAIVEFYNVVGAVVVIYSLLLILSSIYIGYSLYLDGKRDKAVLKLMRITSEIKISDNKDKAVVYFKIINGFKQKIDFLPITVKYQNYDSDNGVRNITTDDDRGIRHYEEVTNECVLDVGEERTVSMDLLMNDSSYNGLRILSTNASIRTSKGISSIPVQMDNIISFK